ncbi:hypothetical protein N7470_007862 [Penicillium chermesinum]|nr:hypothetical protein N7470_007862 [Penicillium chermesinum]
MTSQPSLEDRVARLEMRLAIWESHYPTANLPFDEDIRTANFSMSQPVNPSPEEPPEPNMQELEDSMLDRDMDFDLSNMENHENPLYMAAVMEGPRPVSDNLAMNVDPNHIPSNKVGEQEQGHAGEDHFWQMYGQQWG